MCPWLPYSLFLSFLFPKHVVKFLEGFIELIRILHLSDILRKPLLSIVFLCCWNSWVYVVFKQVLWAVLLVLTLTLKWTWIANFMWWGFFFQSILEMIISWLAVLLPILQLLKLPKIPDSLVSDLICTLNICTPIFLLHIISISVTFVLLYVYVNIEEYQGKILSYLLVSSADILPTVTNMVTWKYLVNIWEMKGKNH